MAWMGWPPACPSSCSALADGVVRVQLDEAGSVKEFDVEGGYVQVTGTKVIILADKAQELIKMLF